MGKGDAPPSPSWVPLHPPPSVSMWSETLTQTPAQDAPFPGPWGHGTHLELCGRCACISALDSHFCSRSLRVSPCAAEPSFAPPCEGHSFPRLSSTCAAQGGAADPTAVAQQKVGVSVHTCVCACTHIQGGIQVVQVESAQQLWVPVLPKAALGPRAGSGPPRFAPNMPWSTVSGFRFEQQPLGLHLCGSTPTVARAGFLSPNPGTWLLDFPWPPGHCLCCGDLGELRTPGSWPSGLGVSWQLRRTWPQADC